MVIGLGFGMPLAPILLGIVTAIGGGLMRDVLAGNPTLLMKKELYAVPVTLGTVVYVAALPFFRGGEVAIGIVPPITPARRETVSGLTASPRGRAGRSTGSAPSTGPTNDTF